ncbi:hypothetical protein SLEP1_g49929 [Rubroshorea leprosula]|uniref:Uncharacterized protein n=2 Tax=Rubroshorea leprosula TaxID=152421 RepID=A0AAV5M1P4_9ROSI|nr:hypothetical protein SLEP1_g49929 [Rubroshorea leprosula]
MVRHLLACFGKGGSKNEDGNGKSSGAVDSSGDGPVVVELFSSQGCATSPQAEVLISRLGRGDFQLEVPVVVLAYHVDYWDYMGWKDPYGSSQWTVRQKAYVEALKLDTMFTPQVVVQGTAQCVASDQDALLSTISNAPRFPSTGFKATFQRPTSESLQVSLSGTLRTKIDNNGVNVMLALYESGLVNDCPKGENKGKVLANDFVVRRLEKVCTVKGISAKKTVTGTVTLALWDGFNGDKCGVAVFLQNGAHQIFGSQSFLLPDDI